MSFFDELKRRNVVRVATAYVVVSWLLLQVSDVLFDFVEAPAWAGKALLGLLAIGFGVALVLSWLFEATPEGVRRDSGERQVDPVRARRLDLLTIAAAIGVAVMFTWQHLLPPSGPPPEASQAAAPSRASEPPLAANPADNDASIAVLPFADLSPEGNQEYFTDGISEEILNVLAAVDGLSVASRTSAFAFRDQTELGIPDIGAALGVRHVLEGSVRMSGSNIRVTAQLIDAASDKHLWSQTFDRELTAENVFEIQDEIASAIVGQLAESLSLTGVQLEAATVNADTQSLDAYQLFLRGRQRFRVRSRSNIPETIQTLEEAVALDPEFARAWAALAAIYGVAPSWGIPGEGEGHLVRAERAARRAMELDDQLALPYAVLGNLLRDRPPVDFSASNELLEQALERDPRETSALLWHGIGLLMLGFFDEAIAQMEQCQLLDPGYENCVVWEGLAQLYAGNYDIAFDSLVRIAGRNATSQARAFALAAVRQRDELTALLAMAWANEAFDTPIEPDLVYRLMTDPKIDRELAFAEYSAEHEALTGEPPDLEDPGSLIPLVFGRYEAMQADPNNMYWWETSFPEFLSSPHRKRLIRDMGIYDYWREHRFPPQCRPLGDDDFECD